MKVLLSWLHIRNSAWRRRRTLSDSRHCGLGRPQSSRPPPHRTPSFKLLLEIVYYQLPPSSCTTKAECDVVHAPTCELRKPSPPLSLPQHLWSQTMPHLAHPPDVPDTMTQGRCELQKARAMLVTSPIKPIGMCETLLFVCRHGAHCFSSFDSKDRPSHYVELVRGCCGTRKRLEATCSTMRQVQCHRTATAPALLLVLLLFCLE